MVANNIVLGIGIATLIIFIMETISPTSRVFAADISCANIVSPGVCLGTTGDDRMVGDNNPNTIDGNQGNDQIAGVGQGDFICGGAGDDKISGGDGFRDFIFGDRHPDCGSTGGSPGADIISGGNDRDIIVHGDHNANINEEKKSDGHKDIIDCGPGLDSVVINISVDKDVATNCESVVAG